jgi:hypothetical protein
MVKWRRAITGGIVMTRSAIALAVLLAGTALVAVGLVAAGDYGVPAGDGAAAARALHCGSIVDPAGYRQGPLTASLAVASLTAMPFAGGAAGAPGSKPTGADVTALDTIAVELMGYSGSRLADDAQAFAEAEVNYNPNGPVDVSYARPLGQAIRALQRDCPGGTRLGLRWRRAR